MAASATPNSSSTRVSDRAGTLRTFGVLMLGAVVGIVGVLPYTLALAPPKLPPGSPPLGLLIAFSVLQNLALVAAVTALSLRLGPQVGLGAPLLRAWLMGDAGASRRFRAQVVPAVLAGAAAAAAVLVMEIFVFVPRLPEEISGARVQATTAWQGFLASFYGGIVEELLLRLGLMTLLVWLGLKLARSDRPGAPLVWGANIMAALVFGLGHLPATAALVAITPLVVTRAVVLNGLAGVVFGWLYWRRGLLAAMVAHFAADLILHVLSPMLLGRG